MTSDGQCPAAIHRQVNKIVPTRANFEAVGAPIALFHKGASFSDGI